MTRLLAALLLLAAAAPARAQQAGGCEPLDRLGALPLTCVDQRPRLDSAGRSRLQRILLRNGGTYHGFQGSFRLAFTIGADGQVIRGTVRVLDADTGRIAQRYPRIIASEIHYAPALRDGTPVPVAYEQRFEYSHAGDAAGDLALPPLALQVRESEDERGGTLRMEWERIADSPPIWLDADSSRARQVDALAAVVTDPGWDSLAVACVGLLGKGEEARVTRGELVRLRQARARIARPGRCPETYASGWATFNPDGTPRVRPWGAGPDPYVVRVTQVTPWMEDRMVVGLRVQRMGGHQIVRCEQRRLPSGAWSTDCRTISSGVF
jgi:hypothetical protein